MNGVNHRSKMEFEPSFHGKCRLSITWDNVSVCPCSDSQTRNLSIQTKEFVNELWEDLIRLN